jgi:hypothetical protein
MQFKVSLASIVLYAALASAAALNRRADPTEVASSVAGDATSIASEVTSAGKRLYLYFR